MDDIYRIYHNEIGISFQWKQDIVKDNFNKFQVIFRDTGFYLTSEEIKQFASLVAEAKERGCCKGCKAKNNCRSILLKTPIKKVDLAVSEKELEQITDLIEGTLFQIELDLYINQICSN